MSIRPLRLALVVIMLAAVAGAAQEPSAQEPAAQGGELAADTLGWHVVRPGDTLEGITEHYLGTATLWRDNWRLNPHIADPHLLRIGSRIRVILHRELPPRTAEVLKVRRRVDQKPHPNPWMPATEGDLLQEQDGVRTHRASSTVLAFDDGTRLALNEDSLVFLREVRRSLRGVARESIEVMSGQADLEARPFRVADTSDIEVILGQVSAEPRPGSAGLVRSRLRRQPGGDAQVMVYKGSTGVEAAGERVEVPAGMGTAVPPSSPPPPPERLLPAPELERPRAEATLPFANPELCWQPVAEAVSYTVEVCADDECERLVERAVGLTGDCWQPLALPEGSLRWRVTAVGASGLDGFPSPTRNLVIADAVVDREAPVVVAWVDGILTGGAAVQARAGAAVGIDAHDDASGIAAVLFRWDQGEWRPWPEQTPVVPATGGAHLLQLKARDGTGRESQVWSIAVEVDEHRPAPPRIHPAR